MAEYTEVPQKLAAAGDPEIPGDPWKVRWVEVITAAGDLFAVFLVRKRSTAAGISRCFWMFKVAEWSVFGISVFSLILILHHPFWGAGLRTTLFVGGDH